MKMEDLKIGDVVQIQYKDLNSKTTDRFISIVEKVSELESSIYFNDIAFLTDGNFKQRWRYRYKDKSVFEDFEILEYYGNFSSLNSLPEEIQFLIKG